MSVLLRELLAPDSMAFHTAHVVIVVPQEPDLEWEALLCLQPEFAVTYLNGDLRSREGRTVHVFSSSSPPPPFPPISLIHQIAAAHRAGFICKPW